jgi:hypothetical protein
MLSVLVYIAGFVGTVGCPAYMFYALRASLPEQATIPIIAYLATATIFISLPLTYLFFGPCSIVLLYFYADHPWPRAAIALASCRERYRTVQFVSSAEFTKSVYDGYVLQCKGVGLRLLDDPLLKDLLSFISELYKKEDLPSIDTFPVLPSIEWSFTPQPLAGFRAELDAQAYRLEHRARILELMTGACTEFLILITRALPQLGTRQLFSITLTDLCSNFPTLILDIEAAFSRLDIPQFNLFASIRNPYIRNIQRLSQALPARARERGDLILPDSHKGTPAEIRDAYLMGTSLHDIFSQSVPFGIPEHLRVEHGVIIARSGGGKSQLLETLILADLAEANPPGLILIDSKGDIVRRLSKLAVFAGRLKDRLLIIDPKDHPALNMFDINIQRLLQLEVEDIQREAVVNDVISNVLHFLSSILGADISNQQNVLAVSLISLLCRIPGATLHTLIEVARDIEPYADLITTMPKGVRDFLQNEYDKTTYKETKTAIIRRVSAITVRETLDRMFSAPSNAIDLPRAINDGMIILISTETAVLKDLSPVIGKYFISRVISAAQERAAISEGERHPVHFYIDEMEPYLDNKTEELLLTMRSYGLGAMLAFHDPNKMGPYLHTIRTNTAIKLVSNVSVEEARPFAGSMEVDPQFLADQKKEAGPKPRFTKFACYTADLRRTVAVTLPFGLLDKEPPMDENAYARLRERNRTRVRGAHQPAPPPTPPPEAPADTKASAKW